MEGYDFQDKFNFADYVFENKDNHSYFPVLCEVSGSSKSLEGFSRYSSVVDVCTTQRIIQEATLPRNQAKYFGNHFTGRLSDQQLANTKLETMVDLFSYVSLEGLMTAAEYSKRKNRFNASSLLRFVGSSRKDIVNEFDGCQRFAIDGIRIFEAPNEVSVEDIENEVINACTTQLKMHGPAVAVFPADRHYLNMCDVPLYEPDTSSIFISRSGRPISHAVMLTGYGVATRRGQDLVPYYSFQNNWGKKSKFTGRIPCSAVTGVYGPRLNKEYNLLEFLHNGGSEIMRLVKLEDIKGRN